MPRQCGGQGVVGGIHGGRFSSGSRMGIFSRRSAYTCRRASWKAAAVHASGPRRIRRTGLFLPHAAGADAAEHVHAGPAGGHPPGNPLHDQPALRHRLHGERVAADRRFCHRHGPAAPLFHAVSDLRGGRGERAEGRFDFRVALEILQREAEYRAQARRPRASSSTSSRPSAAIAWATTAAWRPSPATKSTTTIGGSGSSPSAARSGWSISPT